MSEIIDLLQHRQWLWQGCEQTQSFERVSTGINLLDEQLHGGLPQQGVVEIQSPSGIGELQLWLPYLQAKKDLTVFINPPAHVNAHQLYHLGFDNKQLLLIQPTSAKEALWASEQCLKSHACSSVLLWHNTLAISQAKRLQLASEQGGASLFLFRSINEQHFSLPVALCLELSAHKQGMAVKIKKQKGGWPKSTFVLNLADYWPQLAPAPIESNNVMPFPSAFRIAK
ncbi:translesion DNA synthesis-associated protein ImuA [Pseudoalteromonas sp. S16_S37]|uniref:translesion DNA synthesis-associated protein ImuA n=1 Tax=Pseudoalteromonas sp. S16_S37 TaxID=2720228 RepID=UPI00168040F5|nr:translesion DNA synthesis-associated protein ImuA [Pseudoalteromonas sp. S16_S37]MBD1581435.1 translesion DNA synthesis-associated protein ImuA [Pseudoalteromonas sp. S16_S37]